MHHATTPTDGHQRGDIRDRLGSHIEGAAAAAADRYARGDRKRDIAKDAAKSAADAAAEASRLLAKELTTKRDDGVLPKAVEEALQEIEARGERAIDRMVVVRTPVEEYVGLAMQAVSLGKYKHAIANSEYDTMFHLSLLINGRYRLEKNEVIALRDLEDSSGHLIPRGSDTMAVKMRPPAASDEDTGALQLTFSRLLERTKEHMGPAKFTNYCAKTNNCQDFILAILQSNEMAYPHVVSFVKQDSESIFNQLPKHTTVVAMAATDAAAIGDKLGERATMTRFADRRHARQKRRQERREERKERRQERRGRMEERRDERQESRRDNFADSFISSSCSSRDSTVDSWQEAPLQ